jgi:hypothetical protein
MPRSGPANVKVNRHAVWTLELAGGSGRGIPEEGAPVPFGERQGGPKTRYKNKAIIDPVLN